MSRGSAYVTHDTEALILRRVEYGEADWVLTLFTRSLGRVPALARGARKSQRRFAGALEPFFTIGTRLHERTGTELLSLVHAEIVRARTTLIADLFRMELAGRGLSWIRRAAPPRTAEPFVFDRMERLLDRLSELERPSPELELSEAGLSVLTAFGWAIEFERCVRCNRACPDTRSAAINVLAGGLVCQSCGGAAIRITAEQRGRFARAASDQSGVLLSEDASLALLLVERIFETHADMKPT